MNSLLIMGYTSFDLGIFNEKDIKVSIIKKTIRRKLINFSTMTGQKKIMPG